MKNKILVAVLYIYLHSCDDVYSRICNYFDIKLIFKIWLIIGGLSRPLYVWTSSSLLREHIPVVFFQGADECLLFYLEQCFQHKYHKALHLNSNDFNHYLPRRDCCGC